MDELRLQQAEDLLRISTLGLAQLMDPPDEETAAAIRRATARMLDTLGDGPDVIVCQ